MKDDRLLSVGQLTGLIKLTLEENFSNLRIVGEISNIKVYPSGHWYFSLKDDDAVISCVMWKGNTTGVMFKPTDGMRVILEGKLSVYPPRGNYQFDARKIDTAGEGMLFVAFERLKKKLAIEGLFDLDHKQPIPKMPARIGIVTSTQGAALQDMISVAKRRFPLMEIIIAGALVQGAEAPRSIISAIDGLNQIIDNQSICDVIIIGRGGGSIEDLWAFNDEDVARAIYRSRIPVVSAVGHQTDVTIADFVADLRAATPTAAMELITPDIRDITSLAGGFKATYWNQILLSYKQQTDELIYEMKALRSGVQKFVDLNNQKLDFAVFRFQEKGKGYLKAMGTKVQLLQNKIFNASPDGILKKGFVLVEQGGKFVKRSVDLRGDEIFSIRFIDGKIRAKKD